MRERKDIYRFLKKLKQEVPVIGHLIKVHAKKKIGASDDEGICYGPYKNKRDGSSFFYIVIKDGVSYSHQVGILLHEYAHALDISRNGEYKPSSKSHHRKSWGECYSEAYRAFLRILETQ